MANGLFESRIDRFIQSEAAILNAKVRGIRQAIKHQSEKGRAAEAEVTSFLRSFLPSEYGITSGFVVYHADDCIAEKDHQNGIDTVYECRYVPRLDKRCISKQIDVIIYDALRSGPLARLGTCDLVPLEAVYAYIEVKTSLVSIGANGPQTAINNLLNQSDDLRSMKVRLFHVPIIGTYTKSALFPFPLRESISVRSYVFVLDNRGLGGKEQFRQLLEKAYKDHAGKNVFISGMYINDLGYYRSLPSDVDAGIESRKILEPEEDPLLQFKKHLFIDLSRFPRAFDRWTPAIDRYFDKADVDIGITELIKRQRSPQKMLRAERIWMEGST